jgi:hypothetical protein
MARLRSPTKGRRKTVVVVSFSFFLVLLVVAGLFLLLLLLLLLFPLGLVSDRDQETLSSLLFSTLAFPTTLAMLRDRFLAAAGLLLGFGAIPSSGTLLYVSSYAGTITTLNLTLESGIPTLNTLATTDGCAPNPSWLTLEYSLLYCFDEGLGKPNGSLSSYQIQDGGGYFLLDRIDTISGPVSSVLYGEGRRGLAVAH